MSRTPTQIHGPSSARGGLSLIEVLIGMVMTLIVLGVMISVFASSSAEMATARGMVAMHNQLRVCSELMRSDLERVTVDVRPAAVEAPAAGYFEYIEGPMRDSTRIGSLQNSLGDYDDAICLTVRSDGVPFRGRWVDPATNQTSMIESNVAEIIWFTDFDDRNLNVQVDPDERIAVYRRVLLVRPDLPVRAEATGNAILDRRLFFLRNDVSVSFFNATNTPVANSLEDLTRRENRFAHGGMAAAFPNGYPFAFDRQFVSLCRLTAQNIESAAAAAGLPPPNLIVAQLLQAAGQDVVASDIAAFDLRIWSPDAIVRQANPADMSDQVLIQPGDPGYAINPAVPQAANDVTNGVGRGAFVDLGYGNDYVSGSAAWTGTAVNALNAPQFSTLSNPKAGNGWQWPSPPFPNPTYDLCYDTFSTHYETNGVDDDGDGIIDQGTNGLDDDYLAGPPPTGNGPDDVGERETMPPYPFACRGVEVTFRAIHRETKQIHQTSVKQSYLRK